MKTLAAVTANLPRFSKAGYLTRPERTRVGGLAEVFAAEVAASTRYLRGVGTGGVVGQGRRARDGSIRAHGFWGLRSPGQPDGPSAVVALAPLASVGPCWRILLHPSRHDEQSKTGTQDVTLLGDVREFIDLDKFFPTLKAGVPESKLWPFDYYDLCKQIKKAAGRTGLFRALPVAPLGRELGHGEIIPHSFVSAEARDDAHYYVPGEVRKACKDDQRIRTHPLGHKGLVGKNVTWTGGNVSSWKASL